MKTFKLENEPKIETGFITPEHYFENFSIKMMEQLPKRTKSNFYFSKKKYIYAGSCCFSACFDDSILNPSTEKLKDLDAVALENYITYQSNVNQYDLISVLEAKISTQ
jgi:hypothetical protein